jgi:hypothetical protein
MEQRRTGLDLEGVLEAIDAEVAIEQEAVQQRGAEAEQQHRPGWTSLQARGWRGMRGGNLRLVPGPHPARRRSRFAASERLCCSRSK